MTNSSCQCPIMSQWLSTFWPKIYVYQNSLSIYKCTENTSLIRELDLNIVLWKLTALNRACFKSQQRSLLRWLYQRICIQAPVVQGIRHRVYFTFLDREKSLWAWVRILKSGFDKRCFFLFIVFLHMYLLYIFNNNNYN